MRACDIGFGTARNPLRQSAYSSAEAEGAPLTVPPAIRTWLLFGSSTAVWPLRAVRSEPVSKMLRLPETKISAMARLPDPSRPPARSTWPSSSRVAVSFSRATPSRMLRLWVRPLVVSNSSR